MFRASEPAVCRLLSMTQCWAGRGCRACVTNHGLSQNFCAKWHWLYYVFKGVLRIFSPYEPPL